MADCSVDAFDSRLLASIFLLTEGRDIAGSGLCARDGSRISTTFRCLGLTYPRPWLWTCGQLVPTRRNISVNFASQIPKELFKKTWGITETLGEPRKAAMYLVSTSLGLMLVSRPE